MASDDDCRLSIPCRVAGRCKFDPIERRCVAGRFRDKGVFVGGLVVMGLGGAGILGGLFLLLTYGVDQLWHQGDEIERDFGGILLGAGAGVALVIGTPIVVSGATRIPRATPAALRFTIAF